MTTEELRDKICEILDANKAESIKIIDFEHESSVADYFVICTAKGLPHLKSLAEELDEKMDKEYGVTPIHSEGMRGSKWALIDYGEVIVHIFEENTRMYYSIETLWGNGKNVTDYVPKK